MTPDSPKPARTRRPAADVAASYAEKSRKANERAIKSTDSYKALDAAAVALRSLNTVEMSPEDVAKIAAASVVVETRLRALIGL